METSHPPLSGKPFFRQMRSYTYILIQCGWIRRNEIMGGDIALPVMDCIRWAWKIVLFFWLKARWFENCLVSASVQWCLCQEHKLNCAPYLWVPNMNSHFYSSIKTCVKTFDSFDILLTLNFAAILIAIGPKQTCVRGGVLLRFHCVTGNSHHLKTSIFIGHFYFYRKTFWTFLQLQANLSRICG